MRKRRLRTFPAALVVTLALAASGVAGLSPDAREALGKSQYVYIASTRADGSLGKPAEIWFHVHEESVCVGTPPGSWRVKRIRAGRPGAKIWVGSPQGPSFRATGSLVEDPEAKKALLETFAKKYPDHWPRHEKDFREGLLETGERVLVCYAP